MFALLVGELDVAVGASRGVDLLDLPVGLDVEGSLEILDEISEGSANAVVEFGARFSDGVGLLVSGLVDADQVELGTIDLTPEGISDTNNTLRDTLAHEIGVDGHVGGNILAVEHGAENLDHLANISIVGAIRKQLSIATNPPPLSTLRIVGLEGLVGLREAEENGALVPALLLRDLIEKCVLSMDHFTSQINLPVNKAFELR